MTTKSIKKAKREATAKAAEGLRAARDLMNHGGRHWVKGTERAMIDPATHEPGDVAHGSLYNTGGLEPAYCSIGAIRQVGVANATAVITLAQVIDPERMKEARADATEEAREAVGMAEEEIAGYVEDQMYEYASDVIMTFNDDSRTEWAEVRSAFTAAAKRLADRARR